MLCIPSRPDLELEVFSVENNFITLQVIKDCDITTFISIYGLRIIDGNINQLVRINNLQNVEAIFAIWEQPIKEGFKFIVTKDNIFSSFAIVEYLTIYDKLKKMLSS